MDLTFRHFEKPPQRTLNFYSKCLDHFRWGAILTPRAIWVRLIMSLRFNYELPDRRADQVDTRLPGSGCSCRSYPDVATRHRSHDYSITRRVLHAFGSELRRTIPALQPRCRRDWPRSSSIGGGRSFRTNTDR